MNDRYPFLRLCQRVDRRASSSRRVNFGEPKEIQRYEENYGEIGSTGRGTVTFVGDSTGARWIETRSMVEKGDENHWMV